MFDGCEEELEEKRKRPSFLNIFWSFVFLFCQWTRFYSQKNSHAKHKQYSIKCWMNVFNLGESATIFKLREANTKKKR